MIPINVVVASNGSKMMQICDAVTKAGFKAVSSADTVSVYENGKEVATVDDTLKIHTRSGHLPVREQLKPFLSND
jgi:hypothetical protein